MLIAFDVSKALIKGPFMFLFNETVDLKSMWAWSFLPSDLSIVCTLISLRTKMI